MTFAKHPCLVAITGLKFSGKDTAALGLSEELDFEVVKFADSLKNMLRAILRAQGLTSEEVETYVEGQYKEEPCQYLSAAILSEDAVRDLMLYELLAYQGLDDNRIEYLCRGSMADVPLVYLSGKSFNQCKSALEDWCVIATKGDENAWVTPRWFMQTMGTEWGRDMIAPDLWVQVTNRRVDLFDRVVITDLRFPNENEYVVEKGGLRVRVDRFGQIVNDLHVSEQYIQEMPVDTEIKNDSNIRTLMNRMKKAAESLWITHLEDVAQVGGERD